MRMDVHHSRYYRKPFHFFSDTVRTVPYQYLHSSSKHRLGHRLSAQAQAQAQAHLFQSQVPVEGVGREADPEFPRFPESQILGADKGY